LRKTHYIFIFCLLCLLTLLTNRTFAGGYKFIENKGQWPEHILFKADLGGGVLYVQQTGLYYVLYDALKLHEVKHGEIPDQPIPAHAIRITFEGGQLPAQIQK